MEAQATFVGPDGAVHLDARAAVDLHLSLAVGPGHAEHDDPFRLGHALEDLGLLILEVILNLARRAVRLAGHLAVGHARCCPIMKGLCASHGTSAYHYITVEYQYQVAGPASARRSWAHGFLSKPATRHSSVQATLSA